MLCVEKDPYIEKNEELNCQGSRPRKRGAPQNESASVRASILEVSLVSIERHSPLSYHHLVLTGMSFRARPPSESVAVDGVLALGHWQQIV